MNIEAFFSDYKNTISALGAMSTLAVVITSVWLAKRSEKTRLKAKVYGSVIMHNGMDLNNPPKFISVNVVNMGNTAIRIPFSFFCWEVPFCKQQWYINPMDHFGGVHAIIPKKMYPVRIDSKHSETFIISDRATFHSEMTNAFQQIKFLSTLRANFIKASVSTEDGMIFRASISNELKKELKQSSKRTL